LPSHTPSWGRNLDGWFPAEQIFPEEDQEYSATVSAVRYARAKLDSEKSDAILIGADTTYSGEPDRCHLM
jgi:hypothetical protein